MRPFTRAVSLLVVLSLLIAACGDEDDDSGVRTVGPIIFNGEANRLNAYQANAAGGYLKQTVVERASLDPKGRDLNGQICFEPANPRRFIAGEDTGQPNPPPGWGYFKLRGNRVGDLSAKQIGKLTPTYQTGDDNAENYGCGFLSDGRLLTTDVGNQAAGPGTGQLIIWFPPFDAPSPSYCKLDVAIGTAGSIAIDDQDRVHVASARVVPGIYRYTGPFPTSDDAAGGCGQLDSIGAPLADSVNRERFIPSDANIPTPNAAVLTPQGTFYVASVINGVIAEYDAGGTFVRRVMQPLPGEMLPFPSTGTPFGLGLDSGGTLYYADIGIVSGPGGFGPGAGMGSVRRIRFEDGEPLTPEKLVDTDELDFPDGIGILEE